MKFPNRFYTGIRNTTIPNPADLHRDFKYLHLSPMSGENNETVIFEGLCSDYNFRLQTDNYMDLRRILRRNGTDFLYVAAARYMGDQRNHRFVACAKNGSLLWNKYVAYSAQGGQNHVYVAGMRIKVSLFLTLIDSQQDALLSHSMKKIEKAFGPDYKAKLKFLDESKQLWN